MSERKVLNKYFPPDFDPAKIPRRRQPKNRQMNIRMMLPMSIRCGFCSNYISRGTKFNSRKEEVVDEKYLGLKIWRFYIKCTCCSSEITFKTDPQNSDYIVESGASRNFEPRRAEDEKIEEQKKKRKAEEMGDPIRSLENRALDSKLAMDNQVALEETKSINAMYQTVSTEELLKRLTREPLNNEDDESTIKQVFHRQQKEHVLRRIDDDDLDDSKRRKVSIEQQSSDNVKSRSKFLFKSSLVRVYAVKKPIGLCTQYASDDEEE